MPSTQYMLRGHGDLTIEWDEKNHDEAVKLIQAKMDAGVSFFIVDPTSRKKKKPLMPISAPSDATARKVFVRDADIKHFVESGFASITSFGTTAEMTIATIGKAKTAEQAARTDTVAVQPSTGG